jgi:hypothetical protein
MIISGVAMATTFTDVVQLRQSRLTQVLAGCAAIDPVRVLPLIQGELRETDLTNERARRFITAMGKRLPELQRCSLDRHAAICLEVANSQRAIAEYCGWVACVGDVAEATAKKAIREIQRLAITFETLKEMGNFAASVEEKSRWQTQ